MNVKIYEQKLINVTLKNGQLLDLFMPEVELVEVETKLSKGIVLADIRDLSPELAKLLEKYIELDKKKTEFKKFLDEFDETVEQIQNEVIVGFNFQDDDGIVYQLDRCEWKSVKMTPFVINRTRREGEAKGSMSLKHARELGFIVEGE